MTVHPTQNVISQTGPKEWPELEEFHSEIEELDQTALAVDRRLSAPVPIANGVECSITVEVDGVVHSTWIAAFDRVIENRLVVGQSFQPEAHRTHPLLLDHCENGAELYLAGQPSHGGEARATLLDAHAAVMGEWRPASRYMNSHVDLDELLAGGYGLLASGPTTLIRKMADRTAEQLRISVFEHGEPKLWNEQRSIFEPVGTVSLFMSAAMWDHYPNQPNHRSYVIAAGLVLERTK